MAITCQSLLRTSSSERSERGLPRDKNKSASIQQMTPPLKGGGISTPTEDHLMGIQIPVIVNGTQFQWPGRYHPLIGDREERELMIPRWIGRSFFLSKWMTVPRKLV